MNSTTQKILSLEVAAVLTLIGIIWVNEWLDLPFLLLGAEATPLNYREAVFESIAVLGVCLPLILFNFRILKKIERIAALLPVCSACKKIYDDRELWTLLETCAKQHADDAFTNGICLDCLEKYHPEMYQERVKEGRFPKTGAT